MEEYKENKIRLQKQRESLLENIKELEAQKPEDPSRDNVLSQIRSVYDVLLDPAAESSTKGNFIRTIVDQIVFDKEAEMVYFDIIIHINFSQVTIVLFNSDLTFFQKTSEFYLL